MATTLGGFLIGIGLSLLCISYILYFYINLITPYYYGPFVYIEGPFTYGPLAFGCLLTTAGVYFIIRDRRKEAIPPPTEQTEVKSQFYCKNCGRSFWLDDHRFKISYCQKCGTPNPVRILKEAIPPLPLEELPPPPPLMPKQVVVHWRSQFRCNACGQPFWIDERRTKIPYCPQCGAPDPKVIGQIG